VSEYWIKRDDNEYGPFESAHLREMAKNKQLVETDFIRKGSGPWIFAKSIKGLFGESTRLFIAPPSIPINQNMGSQGATINPQPLPPPIKSKNTIPLMLTSSAILSVLVVLVGVVFLLLPGGGREPDKKETIFIKSARSFQDKKGKKGLPELKENEKLKEEFLEKMERCNEVLKTDHEIVITLDPKTKSDLEITQIDTAEFSLGEKMNPADAVETRRTPREQVIEKVMPAVAIVSDESSTGSGFLISNNIIATNRHVAGELGNIVKVRFPSLKNGGVAAFVGTVIAEHQDRDIALVKIAISPKVSPLTLGSEKDCKPGQELIAIGSPSIGFNVAQNAIRVGNFSSLLMMHGYRWGPPRLMLEMGMPINPGNSGGPVIDEMGKVVGIVAEKMLWKESISFAEPVTELIQLAANVIPGKVMVKKDQNKPANKANEVVPKNNKSFGVNLNFTIRSKAPLDKNLPEFSFLAINRDGAVVAKGWAQSPDDIKVGQVVRLKGWIPIPALTVFESINSFALSKKPDEKELDFMKKFAEVMKAGKVQDCANLMSDFDLNWKDSLVSACDGYKDHPAASTRAALVNAVSFVVNKIPELREIYLNKFTDVDPAVLKVVVDSVTNLDEIEKDVMEKVFQFATNRKDLVSTACLNTISKTAPISNELLQLYATHFDNEYVDLKKAILVSLGRVKGDSVICVPLIKKALAHDDISLNLEAMNLVPKYIVSSKVELLDYLLVNMKKKNAELSKKGLIAFNHFYPFAAKDVPSLSKHVLELPAEAQVQVCNALISLGSDNAAAEDAIEKLAISVMPDVVAAALKALSVNANIRKANIDLVKSYAKNQDKIIRNSATHSLGFINRAGDSVSLLFELLGDSDREVANSARLSLGKMSPPVGVDDIEILKEKINHKNENVRRMAFHVLSEIGKDATPAKVMAAQGLSDNDSMVVFDAIRILDNTGVTDIELAKKVSALLDKASVGISKQKSSTELKADVKPFDVVYEKTVGSVGIVQVRGGSGSCFLVAPRLVVTNKHVSDFVGEQSVVRFPSAKAIPNLQIPAVNVWTHPYKDLAVLRLTIDPALPVLPLRPENEIKPGQEIISIGSPGIPGGRLVQNSIRKGSFSSIQTLSGFGKVLELDLSANFGNSGGPVLDQTGHVIGVIAFGFAKKERMTFAEPASELLPILRKEGVAPKMVLMQNQNGDQKNPVLMQRPPVNSVDTSIVALNYLSKFGPEVKFAIPVLRKVLHLGDSLEMHKAAMHVVSTMKETAVPLIPDLIKKFDYPGRIGFQASNLSEYRKIFLDNKNNQMIREAIASIGAAAAPELAKVLYSPEPSERFGALITLQSMNENSKDAMGAIYRITVSINEKSPLVLQQARETYGRLEPLTKKNK